MNNLAVASSAPVVETQSSAPSPLGAVQEVLDSLIAIGTAHRGLWPSAISLETHEMLGTSTAPMPPRINGQRDCDRSPAAAPPGTIT